MWWNFPSNILAIGLVVSDCSKEILIIAGKGHEKFQIIKNKILKFDDVKMIKLALENRWIKR